MTVQLVTPPPAAQRIVDKLRADLVKLLAETAAGEVTEMFAIVKHADGTWSCINSGSLESPDMIGRIETAKWQAIKNYMETP